MTLIATSRLTIIVGLGVTGLSAARFLRKQGQAFVMMDSREQPPQLSVFKHEFPEARVHLGGLDEQLLAQASEIILSPGLSLQLPEIQAAIKAGASVIGDVELFTRHIDKPFVAITGSNGKTTVTTLVGQLFKDAGIKVAVVGNIGQPVLDALDENVDWYVLELSSFQLETTQHLGASVATVLNVTEDHMDRYDSLADYHRAKQRIYYGAKQVVLNRQDMLTHPPLAAGMASLSVGMDSPDRHGFGIVKRDGQEYLSFEFTPLMSTDDLKIRGRHNLINCLSALAIGHGAGLPFPSMLASLKGFKGLAHRCQYVRTLDQVDYINDSKATNVGATQAAVSGFQSDHKNLIVILGGEGKGADFSPLRDCLGKAAKLIILMGRDAPIIADVIDNSVPNVTAENMIEAVQTAKTNARAGDLVLLSPACASFDMFSGYEDRGNQFIAAVEGLAA